MRLLSGLNDHALSLSRSRSVKNADVVIHEVRKTMKRSRALLKLYRTAIGEEIYQHENTLYRDISRSLSDIRISSVNIKTLNTSVTGNKLKGNKKQYGDLVHQLQMNHKEMVREKLSEHQMLRSITLLLKANKKKITMLPEFECDFAMLAAGLRRMYKRCLVNLQRAMSQPASENIHSFRKPVKYLWNQMIILRPLWPPAIGLFVRQLDTLGERLGVEHDMAELESMIFSNYHAEKAGFEPLIHFIRKERQYTQKLVWPLALKVFAEKPGAFSNRITAYWCTSAFNAAG
ncbi:MAG: CHAD domain-containing protein [Bacteroidales bacterium]|nr:CHAD domain-containing protein [Bacteroidales bacterium]